MKSFRPSIILGGGLILASAFLLFFFLQVPYAIGYDGYYYALQLRSLEKTRELVFSDPSWVYQVMSFLDRIIQNPTLTPKIASALSAFFSLTLLSILGMKTKSAQRSPLLFSLGLLSLALSPHWVFLHMEFVKNAMVLPFFLATIPVVFFLFQKNHFSSKKKAFMILSLFFLVSITFTGHRLMAFLLGGILALTLVLWAISLLFSPAQKGFQGKKALLILLLALGVGTIIVGLLWNLGWLERLAGNYLRWDGLSHRLRQFTSGVRSPWEAFWFAAYQIFIPLYLLLFLFILIRGIKRKKPEPHPQEGKALASTVFLLMAFLCIFPWMEFQWDEWGFRLMILSPVFFFLHCLFFPWPISLPKLWAMGSALLLPPLLFFSAGEILGTWHGVKYPDYQSLQKELEGLHEHTNSKKLIAHRGLSAMIAYEMGIWCENFTPRENHEEYFRLVWGFQKELIQPYAQENEFFPDFSTENYTLVPEKVWQRFIQGKEHLRLLQWEINPFLLRPETGFKVNEKVRDQLIHSSWVRTY